MPIKIPDKLPAANILLDENIFVMSESRAMHQDIRPLRVLILNLMPKKIETETQLLRLLSNTALQVHVDLLRIDDRPSKNTPAEHLDTFYVDFETIEHQYYDGFIITGAPLGQVEFDEVFYWSRLKRIMDWSEHQVTSTIFLCWAAHAAFYHFYGLNRALRDEKLSGVYTHKPLDPHHALLRGFDNEFWVPHSRYAQMELADIEAEPDLEVLARSERAGVYLVTSRDGRKLFVTGHPEYDANTLHDEYQRDLAAGLKPAVPENYYVNDDPNQPYINRWRSHGNLLFTNWLNYHVYQMTPFDLTELSKGAFTKDSGL